MRILISFSDLETIRQTIRWLTVEDGTTVLGIKRGCALRVEPSDVRTRQCRFASLPLSLSVRTGRSPIRCPFSPHPSVTYQAPLTVQCVKPQLGVSLSFRDTCICGGISGRMCWSVRLPPPCCMPRQLRRCGRRICGASCDVGLHLHMRLGLEE
ncbi:hypothetical protein VTK56DRAFT_5708 [Thermocarpiscus australiensis]